MLKIFDHKQTKAIFLTRIFIHLRAIFHQNRNFSSNLFSWFKNIV